MKSLLSPLACFQLDRRPDPGVVVTNQRRRPRRLRGEYGQRHRPRAQRRRRRFRLHLREADGGLRGVAAPVRSDGGRVLRRRPRRRVTDLQLRVPEGRHEELHGDRQ